MRIVRRAAAALLIGAVVSVLVAWGCAIATQVGEQRPVYWPESFGRYVPWAGPTSERESVFWRRWGGTSEAVCGHSDFENAGSSHFGMTPRSGENDLRDWRRVEVWEVGWPIRCLVGADVFDIWDRADRHWQFDVDVGLREDVTLPFRPTFGLVIDSIVFALPFALVPELLPSTWRRRRRRRGQCERCAYPVFGIERCPECGTDVPRSANGDAIS